MIEWTEIDNNGRRTELFGGTVVLEVTVEESGAFQAWVTIGETRFRSDSQYTNYGSAKRDAAARLLEIVAREAAEVRT